MSVFLLDRGRQEDFAGPFVSMDSGWKEGLGEERGAA